MGGEILKSYIHRKDSIVYNAIEIIDELGLKGLSSREIAKREGVSEGTLFRHFRTMNEIVIAVLNHFSQFDDDIKATVLLKEMNFKDSVIYCIKALSEYYESNPPSSAVVQAYDQLRCDKELMVKVEYIYSTRCNFITELCDKAKMRGEIPSDVSSEYMSDIIMGFSRNIILKWRISNYSFSLKERIISTFEMFLKAYI